jgi:type III restriction enzyme
MNKHVNAIAGRLSLRPPQRESLEILDRITEIVPPTKTPDVAAALAIIKSEFPKVSASHRSSASFGLAKNDALVNPLLVNAVYQPCKPASPSPH